MHGHKKILFLDDNNYRHIAFRMALPGVVPDCVFTAEEAVKALMKKHYNIVFLDHDLGGQEFVPSDGDEPTGYKVAEWMAANEVTTDLVVIHSMNPVGTNNMYNVLRKHLDVIKMPFFLVVKHIEEILSKVP